MKSIFSYDSKLISLFSHIMDMLIVNLLYIICSLPVISIGSANAALYTVGFQWANREDAGAKSFLKAFLSNLRQATIPWFLMLVIGLLMAYSAMLAYLNNLPGEPLFWIVFALLLILYALVFAQLFLVCAKFSCSFRQTMKNALLIGLAHPICTMASFLMIALPGIVLYVQTQLFLDMILVWFLIYFSIQGYLVALLCKKTYQRLEERFTAASHSSQF